MIGLNGWLLWQIVASRLRAGLQLVGVLAAGWMLGIIGFVLPAMDAAASPRAMFQETKALLPHPHEPLRAFQHWDWRGDEDLFYWQYRHPGAGIIGWQKDFDQALEDLRRLVEEKGQVVIFMTTDQFVRLKDAGLAFTVERLRDFNRGKRNIVLVRLAAS